MKFGIALTAIILLSMITTAKANDWTDPYDVVWTTPSKDAAGSMPLGNGEVGINLWVEENGDLNFYISRSDSLSEIGRLLKVGQIKVAITPNPFVTGAKFEQRLHLHDGVCELTAGEGAGKVAIKVFVDPDSPVVNVLGESASPVRVKATAISWRKEKRVIPKPEQRSCWTMRDAPFDLVESADVFVPDLKDAVAWYHCDSNSCVSSTIEVQSLQAISGEVTDTLLHRMFGGYLVGEDFNVLPDHAIQTPTAVGKFQLRVAAPCVALDLPANQRPPEVPTNAFVTDKWFQAAQCAAFHALRDRLRESDRRRESSDSPAKAPKPWSFETHPEQWWHDFWDRSYVITDAGTGIEIPVNKFPLRIGFDSDNSNKFPGELARWETHNRAWTAAEVAATAAIPHDRPPEPVRASEAATDFSHSFTLAAWIKPDYLTPGRIFDKMTANGSDGFIFDTYPGNTLRLIVGNVTLSGPPNILTAGRWHHAAATLDSVTGSIKLYLDGKVVAERPGDDVSPITRAYTLQRYVQACGGRGNFPIKFNGGIFTVEPKAMGQPFNADYRAWGECYWWQNTRHMYHPMLAGGDTDMTDPLFNFYESVRPVCEARAALYHHCKGCYFPETITAWGTYSNGDYGWNRTGHQPEDVQCPYWQYAWNQGPELVGLMLDRWDYTNDPAFVKKMLLPMATSVLKYFDTRFKKDDAGRIVLDPTQSAETYWTGVINDMPTTAGLVDITTRLVNLPEALTTPEQRAFFLHMKDACPVVPIEEVTVDGKTQRRLAPAQKFDHKTSNCENTELYAVWPFRLFGIAKPGLDAAVNAYNNRKFHLDVGWGYDGNCAALLGLTDEAARILRVKCANNRPGYRWPATWGPNFDWLPDQNHGGNLLETTQLMLLQCDGSKIRLLPAWPRQWDVSFKLHATGNTVVECVYRAGKVEKLTVTPESRRKDVVLP